MTSADIFGDEIEAEERARRRRRRPVVVGVVLVAMLAVAGWVAGFVLTGATPGAAPSGGPPAQTTPQQVVPPRPVPVPVVTSAAEEGGIRFTWTYVDEQPGDRFRVLRTDTEDQQEVDVTATTYLVPEVEHACLVVRLVRANGQVSQASRVECFP